MPNSPLETAQSARGDNLEERVRAALARSPVVLFSQDSDLRYTWMFNAYPGFTAEEILGRRDEDIFSPRDAALLTAIKRRALETGQGVREEVRVVLRGATYDIDISAEPLRESGEAITGVTGAVLDITPRKRAEAELAASEERYRSVSELVFGFVYSYRVESSFKITLEWLSGRFRDITGLSEEEAAVRGGWMMLIYPEDRTVLQNKVRTLLAGREDVSEYRIFTRESEVRWVRDYSRPVWDAAQGRVVRIYGAAVDITERREAADALRKSEERFRLLAENAADMIYRMNLSDGRYDYVSPASTRITGYEPEEFYKNPLLIRKLLHPDSREYFEEQWKRLQAGEMPLSYEFEIIDKSGRSRWLLQRNSLVRDEAGRTLAIEGIITDITERKMAEQELRESEERFRRLAEAASEGIVIHENGIVLETNESYAAMLGYTLPEIIGQSLDKLIAPEYLEIVMQHVRERDETPYEAASVRKDGALIFHETRGKTIPLHGRMVRVTTLHDITDRKEAERELRESEKRYRSLFENMLDGLAYCRMIFDPENRPVDFICLQVNSSFERLIGQKDATGKRATEMIPGIRESNPELFEIYGRVALTGSPERFETFVPPLNLWFSVSVYSTETGYFTAIFDNITERKNAEEALRESEKRFASAFEFAAIGMALVDPDGRFRMVNHSLCDMFGYSEEELLSKTFQDITYPDDLETDLGLVRQLLAGEMRTYQMEKRYIHKQGYPVWALLSVSLIRDEQDRPRYFISQIEGITERKRAEAALRESEERFRSLVETTSDWVWEVDENGRYTYTSPKVRELLGYEPEEVLGKLPHNFMPPEEAARVYREVGSLMEQHLPVSGVENTNLRKDGTTVVLETSGVPVFDANGVFRGYRGIDRDITERKRVEEALRESEERYRRLFSEMTSGLALHEILTDEAGNPVDYRFLDINPAFERLTGLKREDVVGRTVREVIPDIEPEWIERYVRVALTGESVHFENYAAGLGRWYDVVAFSPLPRQFAAMFTDITGMREAEEELTRSEERYRRLFEDDLTGDYLAAPSGEIIVCNPSFAAIFGFESPRLAARTNIKDLYTRPEAWDEFVERLRRENKIELWESDRKRSDSTVIQVVENAGGRFDDQGELREIYGYIFDITERRKAERELQKATELLDATQEITRVGGWEYDAISKRMTWTKEVYRIYGVETDYDPSNIRANIDFYAPECVPVIEKAFRDAAEKGEPYDLELRFIPANGESIWVRTIGSPVVESGRVVRVNGNIMDITSLKRAKDKLKEDAARREATLNALPDMLFEVDREGRIYTFNAPHPELLFRAPDEFLGRTMREILPAEAAEVIDRTIAETVEKGRSSGGVYSLEIGGEIKWFELSSGADGDPHAPNARFVILVRDITERKRVEEHYRSIFDNAPLGIFHSTLEGQFTRVNPALVAMLGYDSPEDLMETVNRRSIEDVLYVDPSLRAGYVQKVLESGSWQRFENRYYRKDGRIIITSLYFRPYATGGGKTEFEGFIEDITERKRAEEALRESEERFRAAFENGAIAMALTSPDSRILKVNAAFCEMVGFSESELVGHSISEITFPEDLPENMEKLSAVFSGEESKTRMEKRYIHKDGRVIWVDMSTASVRDAEGKPVYIVTHVQDITERKRAEEALRESEERYRRLADSTYEGIIIHADGVVIEANTRFSEMMGYTPEELIGKPVRDFVHPEKWEEVREIIRTGREGAYESRIVRKDGKVLDVEVVARIVPWHGRTVRMAALRDITERRELEGRIADLRREYEVFMRHEVKNLLVPIELEMDRFLENPPDCLTGEQRNVLERVQGCIKRAERMVDALKRLQDMETGRYALRKTRCSLKSLLSAVIGEVRGLAERYGVALDYVPERIKSDLYLDRDLMPGVFSNLILNAIQHVAHLTDPAEKRVTVTLTGRDGNLVVKIHNRGAPISPARLKTFFDKFNTGPENRFGGTGLGTTYARLVVRAHAGDIDVSSSAEEGTMVTVILPREYEEGPKSKARSPKPETGIDS